MTWALVSPNDKTKIFKTSKHKYDLLKFEVQLKEPVSKKTIKQIKEGDIVTVVFSKTYEKWMTSDKGRYYKDTVTETNERQYMLVRIGTLDEKNPWKDQYLLIKEENQKMSLENIELAKENAALKEQIRILQEKSDSQTT